MRRLKKVIGAALLMSAITALAACGRTAAPQQAKTQAAAGAAGTAGSASETGAAGTEMTQGAAAQQTAAGGKAAICYPDILTTCFLPFSSSTGDRFSVAPAIESLGRTDIEGNVSGWLADSFEVEPDTLSVTIKLKKGIKFSDGTDFNADAVIWNFNKMFEGGKSAELGSPESFEKLDDATVLVKYKEWANNWETVLSEVYIYCPSAFEQNGQDWAAINAVGTGPYIMTEYVKEDHISYKKNENYWQAGKPYLDELKIVFMTDITAQQAALMNNEIDMISTNNATLTQTLMSAGFENIAKKAPDLGAIKYMMFASGDEQSPFSNLKVREAVSHAIDWEGYVYSLTGGLGISVTQFGVPGAWSYDETVRLPEFNVAEAKKLLAEAGYPNGFNTSITTISGNNDIAVLLQASLKALGINAEIKVVEASDFNAQKKEGVYDGGIITGQGASKLDFTNNYIRLYSSQGVNYLKMMAHPQDYETALFGARAAKTLDEKKLLLKEASKKLVAEHKLILPMAATFSTCFSNNRVKDSGIYQTSSVQWTPEELKLAQ